MTTLRPRLKIVEMFSTFVHFQSQSDVKWNTSNQLRRSIENCHLSSESEQTWSAYWYGIWRSSADALAFMHLSAYLQEPCYWAAISIMKKFSSSKYYELSDFFQMGIVEVKKICNGFNPERSSNLKAYAMIAFPSLLKDILRRQRDTDICTNYGLLRKVTKKQLGEALENAALTSEEISKYILAWKCFRVLYNPRHTGNNRLPEPDQELWLEIANLYNRERRKLIVDTELDPKTIQQWLERAAVWIRSYRYPAFNSLNVYNLEGDSVEEWNLPEELTCQSPMIELIETENIQERQNKIRDIHAFLLAALKRLTPEMREILHMYYQENLTQKEIALKVNKPQAWVSRRLSASRETLLKELTKWEQESQEQQKVNVLPNPNELKDRSVALEEWLQARSWS